MNLPTLNSAIPFAIVRKLGLIRQRKMIVQVACAIVAALAVLLAAMGVAMLIDWLATLYNSRWRIVLTFAAIAVAGLTTIGWLAVAWRRALSWSRLASDVDREVPQLEERWTTMTLLRQEDATNSQLVHPAMLRQVASEANRWEPHVAPEQVVSMSTLLKTLIGLTVVTAVLAFAVILDARQTWVLVQRFWLPGSSISATELVDLPGDIVVGRKEPVALDAKLRGKAVDRATLFLRNGENQSRSVSLIAHGREPIEFSHRVRSVNEPFSYRFRAGDGQTAWFNVGVADRPDIDKLDITITPPTYTRQEAKTVKELPQRLSVLERSELTLALRPDIPVERVELRMEDGKTVQLTADEDGWYRWQKTLTEGLELTPILTESHGLTNRRPAKLEVSVYPDNPPSVKVLSPDDEIEVRPDDTIQISFTATDDVAIGEAELLVYDDAAAAEGVEPQPLAKIPIPLGEQAGATSVQQKVDLELAKLGFVDGSKFSYEIRVREDRSGSPPAPAGTPHANVIAQATPATGANSPSEAGPPQPSSTTTPSPGSPAPPQADGEKASSAPEAAATAQKSAAPGSQSPSESTTAAAPTPPTSPSEKTSSPAEIASREPMEPADQNATEESATSPPTDQVADSSTTKSAPSSATDRSSTAQASPGKAKPEPSQSPEGSQTEMAKDEAMAADEGSKASAPGDEMAKPNKQPSEPGNAQVATTARRPLGGSKKQPDGNESQPTSQNQESPSGSQTASSSQPSESSTAAQTSPGDSMPRRGLDVPQSAASQRMQINVDQWAGSFTGQQRAKAEMAIAPALESLDQTLAKAERTAGGVLDDLAASGRWGGRHDRDVTAAEKQTGEAQQIIVQVERDSKDTPYAFVGLQLVDVGIAHVNPAKQGFWKALESEGEDRIGSVRDARQHLGRARELLAELRGQFERSRKEFQLAESVERVKKMYRVFVENSQALLQTAESDPNRYGRDMAEFELDDEYLARLQEVLEMRRDLMNELARILAEDPRLLRRFMDSMRKRATNLREQLAELVANQQDLNREVKAWTLVEEADRPRIARILMLRQLQDASKIAAASGDLQSRYQAWLPLDRESEDADLAAASEKIQRVATAGGELTAMAQKLTADAQRPVPAESPPAESQPTEQANADPATNTAAGAELKTVIAGAERMYEELKQLEVTLRQLAARDQDANTSAFATTRLVEARRLIADTSAFVRQMRAHDAGTYPRAAEVDQYRLAMKTDELAGKLGSIEQSLAGLMQRTDGSLPEPIARKSRDFLTTLDKQVSPNQLAGVYALHRDQLPRAVQRQQAAGEALAQAEKQFDEMMRMAIEEMDKLPVQDPIADLLDDPTLDELLAQLEQESALLESLGIPQRPSNLQIIGDWMRPGSGGGSGGGAPGMVMNQLRNEEERAQRRLNQTYDRAIARALKETTPKQKVVMPEATKLSDWNQLVSDLGDDLRQGRDKAPPEQYRRAIEQYFTQISGVVAEQESESP